MKSLPHKAERRTKSSTMRSPSYAKVSWDLTSGLQKDRFEGTEVRRHPPRARLGFRARANARRTHVDLEVLAEDAEVQHLPLLNAAAARLCFRPEGIVPKGEKVYLLAEERKMRLVRREPEHDQVRVEAGLREGRGDT